jgi:integrase
MANFQQLPSGNWRALIRKQGIQRSKTFPNKTQAKQWAASIESQAANIAATGKTAPPKGATIADLIDRNMDLHPPSGRNKANVLLALKRDLGHVPLDKLTALHLRDYVDKRVSDGAGGVTISIDLSTLATLFKWAREVRHLDVNEQVIREARSALPARGLTTRSDERAREPTPAEMELLYKHWRSMKRQKIPMEDICKFALATGMRLSEICRIRESDIDWDAKTVLIRDRKDPRRKHGNDQLVPLLPAAYRILEVRKGRELIWGSFTPHSVSTMFARAVNDCGIDDLRFHDLRHKATGDLFRMGFGIQEVAVFTGHKTWAQLRRYTVTSAQDIHNRAELLNLL